MISRINHNKIILNTVVIFFVFFVFSTTIPELNIITVQELYESGSKNRDNAESNNNSINSNIDYYYSYEKDNDHVHIEEAFYNRETGDSGRYEYCSNPDLHDGYQGNNTQNTQSSDRASGRKNFFEFNSF